MIQLECRASTGTGLSTVYRDNTPEPIHCASSVARRQNAFGCRATDLRLVCYTYFGTYATLPGHEGDERD